MDIICVIWKWKKKLNNGIMEYGQTAHRKQCRNSEGRSVGYVHHACGGNPSFPVFNIAEEIH
jgi:hypothetical protein